MNILQPGPGVGGHCLAVDPWFIVDAAPEEAKFIRAARETNLRRTDWVVEKVVAAVEKAGPDATIACLGLAYKADVDDLRESPAISIAVELAGRFPGRVRVVDPFVAELPEELARLGIRKIDQDGVSSHPVVVGLVNHRSFGPLRDAIDRSSPEVLDFAGIWDR